MPTINSNVADYLTRIEKLTATNLQILKTLNDSFFTKKNHLYAEVDDTTYVIPSFISLENKINMLQENFENLVKAPETCEAYFNFDGNTRAIEVRKYSHVPDAISLPTVTTYNHESNDIFKDFMTPVPFINLDLPYIPNDIVEVNVKKIIAKSEGIKSLFRSKLEYTQTSENGTTETLYKQSVNETYGNIHKLLINYNEDSDYIEYDTIYKLPIRKNIGTGTYIIESVLNDHIDDDLNEFITLKINNKLSYKLFDDTIEKQLQVGDHLINFDGTGKVMITDIRPSTNTITVKVVNGEYLNFLGTDSYDTNNGSDIHDLSKLRFYAAVDFDADKYIKIPLEEDQYVFIAVSAVNSRMNLQSSWGTGLVIDTHSLINPNDNNRLFKSYYDDSVKNIGDVLFEMTSMITSPITSLSEDNFNALSTLKPVIDTKLLSVMQINKHLNNSITVKNIRDAYNQKKTAEADLEQIQSNINNINNKLASISFDDTTGVRSTYTAQLTSYNTKKNELLTVINNAVNTIALNANSADIPIENAKYHIRGFYIPTLSNVDNIETNNHVIGVQVQYRYKNSTADLGFATSISGNNGETYIYSDWNELHTTNKNKIASCKDGDYQYAYESSNENKNEPSYNQIDIPISQGETVDVRLRAIYDFGQPYITMTSAWSDIVNIEFPDEFTKDVPILSIIEENNVSIETNRFNNILETTGVNDHINDTIIDQNITFYHKPDNIASGFYTEERRVIPLKDKLMSLSNDIAMLMTDVYDSASNCKVSVSVGDAETVLYSDRDNSITLEPWNNFNNDTTIDGAYYKDDNNVISTILNISIANTGNSTLKLYSIFPGNRDTPLNAANKYIDKSDGYILNILNGNEEPEYEGVRFAYRPSGENSNNGYSYSNKLQTLNQFIMFRTKDVWTGESYYSTDPNDGHDNVNLHWANESYMSDLVPNDVSIMSAYPIVETETGLCMDSDAIRSYITINPGNEIVVPIKCQYYITEDNNTLSRCISFDLRTSLYSDPINYSFKIVCKYSSSTNDKLTLINKKRFWDRLINPSKYNITVK